MESGLHGTKQATAAHTYAPMSSRPRSSSGAGESKSSSSSSSAFRSTRPTTASRPGGRPTGGRPTGGRLARGADGRPTGGRSNGRPARPSSGVRTTGASASGRSRAASSGGGRGSVDVDAKSPSRGDRRDSRDLVDSRSNFGSGDKVKAKCKGWTKHYPGTIKRDNGDGTYDIEFDDGETKRDVPRAQVEAVDTGRTTGDRDRDTRDTRDTRGGGGSSGALSRGDKVTAKVKGWTKHYPGTIKRDNGDGTFDIEFDDGETKRDVPRSMIEGGSGSGRGGDDDPPLRDAGGGSSSSSSKLSRGDKVKAKVKGWTKHYPGTWLLE